VRRLSRLTSLTGVAAASLVLAQLATWQASRAQTCNVRVEIETPADNATVQSRQAITGWAADLGASSGTGVDAVVASLDGALDSPDNRLVGVAEYGAARPDIAQTLGDDRFTNSGYTFTWDTSTAPSGTHPLFLQAHSACGWHTTSHTVTIPGGVSAAAPAPAAAPSPTVGNSITVVGGTATVGVVATPTRPAVNTAPATAAASGGAGGLVLTPGAFAPPPTTTALQPPSNLRLAGATSTGVTLSWDPPPGAPPNSYLIYESTVTATGGNATPVVVARVPGTSTSVTLSGLQDPTRYTYYFTVATGAADGTASPYLLTTVSTTPANTRVPVPPTPPGGLPTATVATVPGANLTPNVTPAAGAAAPASGGASGSFAASVSAAGSNGATVTWTAQPGATAYNVYGAAMLAAPAGQTPLAGAPPNPLASAQPGTWVAVASNVSGTSTSVTGLAPGGMYEFLVRAVNASGGEFAQTTPQQLAVAASAAAPAASAPPAGSVPAAPGTPTAANPAAQTPATSPANFLLTVSPTTNTSLTLSWVPYAGATTYGVLVSRPPGGQFVADSSRAALTTTGTVIDGLTPGSQFTFVIAAKDANGHELARTNQVQATVGQPAAPGPLGMGPFPQATTVATPILVPTASLPGAAPAVSPVGVGAPGTASLQLISNPSDPGTANLQWNPVPGAASYSVWAMSPGGQMQVVVPSTQNAAAYIPNLPAGQMTFQVRARDANGTDMAQSNPVTATIAPH